MFPQLLGISYRDHITNEEVKARIGNAVGPYEDLTSVKRHKLKCYGHVTRSSGLAKTILQGTVQRGRRGSRQRKQWEDNIKEWTGLEWNIIPRKAENREEWRKLVVKSTVYGCERSRLEKSRKFSVDASTFFADKFVDPPPKKSSKNHNFLQRQGITKRFAPLFFPSFFFLFFFFFGGGEGGHSIEDNYKNIEPKNNIWSHTYTVVPQRSARLRNR